MRHRMHTLMQTDQEIISRVMRCLCTEVVHACTRLSILETCLNSTASNSLSSDTSIRFYRISESWDASEVTYNSRPSVSSSNSKRKTLEDTDTRWETFNITEIVEDIIRYGGHGVRIEIDANRLVRFDSIENGGHEAKLEITTKTPSGGLPVINSITWSPKGSASYVGVGATYYGRHGSSLKVTRVSAGTTSIRIGTVTHTFARGETFTLDGESYTLLHVLSDGECSAAVIAKNGASNMHPALGESVAFSVDVAWNDDGSTTTSRRAEWFYLKPSSETYSQAYANDINNWTHFATGTIVNQVFDDDDVIYIKVITRNKANLTAEYGMGTCGVGQFNLWATGGGFEITVVDADGTDKLTIAEAELIPGTDAWIVKPVLLPFGVSVMQWFDVENGKYVGISDPVADEHYTCGQCDPSPDFCNLHLVAGKNYAIFRSTSGISVVDGDYVHIMFISLDPDEPPQRLIGRCYPDLKQPFAECLVYPVMNAHRWLQS